MNIVNLKIIYELCYQLVWTDLYNMKHNYIW
jgi:hypothetical protein